tara:strand:+ start:4020 stop:5873 length:1854 start_codon:yes stop_codon:yes gene_type:complete
MAIEKTINLNVDSKAAVKSVDGLSASINDLSTGAEDVNKGTNLASKGFKGLGVAMKAAGIGLVIAAIGKLGEVFSQNQKVADIFKTSFEAVSIVFNDFVSFIVNNTGAVTKFFKAVFENPKKSLESFAKAFKENIQERFESYLDTLGLLASAVKKVFSGDFAGALDDVKQAGKESIDVLTGVNNSFDKGKEFVEDSTKAVLEYGSEVLKASQENVKLANASELAAAQQGLLVEKYDRQAEQLRQIRDDERNSLSDRKKANEDLLLVLAEQESSMLSLADAQLRSAQAEASKNNSIENQVAVTEALANKLGVLAQVEGFRSEQQANDLALSRESIELTNSKSEAESNLSIERQRFNAEQIDDELLKLEALKSIDEAYTEKEAIRLQAIVDNANAETQAKIDAQITLDEFEESSRQLKIENQTAIDEVETERKQKTADDEIAIAKALADSKKAIQDGVLDVVSKGIGVAKDLAGKNKGVQKALLIAENAAGIAKILINTAVANASAVATSPITGGMPWVAINSISGALGIAGAVSATAKGLQALGGGGGGSKPSIPKGGGGGGAAPTPPSFNIVGSSETSVLSDSVASQTNEPVQAYVVSNDVTTAQSLQNNIVDGATI